jgi:hypothetical protein
MIDMQQISGALAISSVSIQEWASRFLTLWLIEDHGLVNELGHGNPEAGGYNSLPDLPVREGAFRTLPAGSRLSDVLEAGSGMIYQMVELPRGWMGIELDRPFAALLHFKHTPNDAVFLVLAKEEGVWKIVRMFPLLD